jgi:hypothetical protein
VSAGSVSVHYAQGQKNLVCYVHSVGVGIVTYLVVRRWVEIVKWSY